MKTAWDFSIAHNEEIIDIYIIETQTVLITEAKQIVRKILKQNHPEIMERYFDRIAFWSPSETSSKLEFEGYHLTLKMIATTPTLNAWRRLKQ